MYTDELRQPFEDLCAAVIEAAYQDYIDALLCDAMMRFKGKSYNCTMRYREFTHGKRIRHYIGSGGKWKTRSLDEQWNVAQHDMKMIEAWFLSERFNKWAQGSEGTWFVRKAKRKAMRFALDEIMEIDCYPEPIDRDDSWYKQKKQKWQAERDKWREEQGLEKARDE